jgi:hypothetical protein
MINEKKILINYKNFEKIYEIYNRIQIIENKTNENTKKIRAYIKFLEKLISLQPIKNQIDRITQIMKSELQESYIKNYIIDFKKIYSNEINYNNNFNIYIEKWQNGQTHDNQIENHLNFWIAVLFHYIILFYNNIYIYNYIEIYRNIYNIYNTHKDII